MISLVVVAAKFWPEFVLSRFASYTVMYSLIVELVDENRSLPRCLINFPIYLGKDTQIGLVW